MVTEVSGIVVTSDSEYMLQLASQHGVAIHRRPVEYCDEVSRSFGEMVKYCLFPDRGGSYSVGTLYSAIDFTGTVLGGNR